ncbi:MAG: hypothetical protein DHS20C17_27420 [Cyclobacteriaceae bacterium]|nr:MAG: hypothetical protein DHS20C17_27420 [Cyclobacteriaceae bacterium]
MWKYIISAGLLICGFDLIGQVELQGDTTVVRPPRPPKVKKEAKEFIPSAVRFGVDLNSFSRNFWDDSKKLQEYQLDIDFRHYLLTFDYGTSNIEEQSADIAYQNKGTYFRIGPEINLMHHPEKLHVVFVGFRYASAKLDDQLTYNTEDAYGTFNITASNDNATAQWAELVTGTKINFWKGLFIGFTVRYKFLKTVNAGDLEPYWIPGFGENRQDDKDQFGFSYYVYWRFGFRKSNSNLLN